MGLVGNRLRKTAGQVERKVLDEIAHADGGDHQRHFGAERSGLYAALHREAERDRQNHDGGQGRHDSGIVAER